MLCRRQRAAELSTRLLCEGFEHEQSLCATLTYADEHLPALGSVSSRDIELFLKRHRINLMRSRGKSFRLRYHCQAEYSPDLMRPHYHVALFNYWPHDAKPWANSRAGNPEFVSDELTAAWGKGFVTFQTWSAGAAGYVAGHQAHKLTGRVGEAHRRLYSPDGLFLGTREPEFSSCSRRPGLGAAFLERYARQLLTLGFTVPSPGKQVPLPGYFLRRAKDLGLEPDALSALVAERGLQARLHASDSTRERLAVREACALADVKRIARNGVER